MDEYFVPEVRGVSRGLIRFRRNWYGRRKGETLKYRWKTKPYRHQVMAIKKLLKNGFGGALLMDPRTGKTKTAIDYASILHQSGKVGRVLIFCPVSVIGVWEDEIEAHCPFPHRITIWDKRGRKRSSLPRFGDTVLDFVIMNYDALSTAGRPIYDKEGNMKGRSRKRGGRYDIFNALESWQPQLIILDESHRIKSPNAVKSRMIRKLGPVADYRLILTGTVVTKKKRIFDIWSQWQFLMPGRFPMTHSEFKNFYGVWVNKQNYSMWIKNRHQDILHQIIHRDAFAISRAECFDLPKRTEQVIHVDLVESAPYYDKMAEEMVAQLETGEITEASIVLVKLLRLRQIASGVAKTEPTEAYPKGRLVRIGREKIQVMEELLYDLFEADEKVVVGAHFIADINAVTDICKKLKVDYFVLRGGVDRRQRDADIKAFRAHDGPACFIAQPQAASLGIDLRTASIMIWFSLTPSYVDYTQFEDRIALSDKPTTFMYLLARGTVDEDLYQTLQEDGDVAKAIMASPDRLRRNVRVD